jgi:hypothetical protein
MKSIKLCEGPKNLNVMLVLLEMIFSNVHAAYQPRQASGMFRESCLAGDFAKLFGSDVVPAVCSCFIMSSSSSGFMAPLGYAEASSSRNSQLASVEDDSDNDDPTLDQSRDQALLTTDPLYSENDNQ